MAKVLMRLKMWLERLMDQLATLPFWELVGWGAIGAGFALWGWVSVAVGVPAGHALMSLVGIVAGGFLSGVVARELLRRRADLFEFLTVWAMALGGGMIVTAIPWFIIVSVWTGQWGWAAGLTAVGVVGYWALYAWAWQKGLVGRLVHPPGPWQAQFGPVPAWMRPGTDEPVILVAQDQEGLIGVRAVGRRELDHVLFVAGTRAGKGLAIVANLLRFPGPCVVLDIKGEAYRKTARFRQEFGPVIVLTSWGAGFAYDPVADLDDAGCAGAAEELLFEPGERDPVFAQRAAYLVEAALLAARRMGRPAVEVLEEVFRRGPDEAVRWLSGVDEHVGFLCKQFWGGPGDERFRMSAWSTAAARLRAFWMPGIRRLLTGRGLVHWLLGGMATVYLVFEEASLEATTPVLRLILFGLQNGLLRAADREFNGWLPWPVLFLLDEVGRCPPAGLPAWVSTWAGRNMYCAAFAQDLSQLQVAYGQRYNSILANSTQVFYFGNSDLQTARYVSERLGMTTVETISVGPGGAGMHQTARALVTVDEFQTIPPSNVVVFPRAVGSRPFRAFRLDPRLWRDWERLEDAELPSAPAEETEGERPGPSNVDLTKLAE